MSRRDRECHGKHPHPNRTTALDAMHSLARNRGAHLADMHVYRCRWCAAWHVGHRRGARRRR